MALPLQGDHYVDEEKKKQWPEVRLQDRFN